MAVGVFISEDGVGEGGSLAGRYGFALPAYEDGKRAGQRGEYVESATCIIVTPNPDPHVLFIHRAEREGDPWSGNIGVPGGRVEGRDASLCAGAQREALEEVGVALGEPVGRLPNTVSPVGNGMVVATFLFDCPTLAPVTVQTSEVQSAFWWPVRELIAPERQTHIVVPGRSPEPRPAIRVGAGDAVLWGMTYSWIAQWLHAIGVGRETIVPYMVSSP